MSLDRYANIQVKKALEGLINKPVSIVKSAIDRTTNTVKVTLDSWTTKQMILHAIKLQPFAGVIRDTQNNDDCLVNYDHKIDKVQAKMAKFSLGVSKYTSNNAVFRELGQYPVSIKAKVLAVMYFHRLCYEINSESNPLLHAAFNCMKLNSHPWIDNVKFFFAVNGLTDLYNKIMAGGVSKGMLKTQVKLRLTDMYKQHNNSKLEDRSYLQGLYELTKGK